MVRKNLYISLTEICITPVIQIFSCTEIAAASHAATPLHKEYRCKSMIYALGVLCYHARVVATQNDPLQVRVN
jgi:hypothetical protein